MFMEYVFDISVGLFTEKVTLKSLKNTWYCFRSAYERATYTSISKDVGNDVLAASTSRMGPTSTSTNCYYSLLNQTSVRKACIFEKDRNSLPTRLTLPGC